jgi:hypothetical protein
MTFDLATALLNRAGNGNELMAILDSIVADNEQGIVTDTDGTPLIW